MGIIDRLHPKARAHKFIVPLTLDDCKQRIEACNEPATLIVLFPSQRTVAWVGEWDQATYGFVLKRRSKSSLAWDYASLAAINGFLREVDSDHTLVLFEKRVSLRAWLPMLMTGFLAVVGLPLLCLSGDPCEIKAILITCVIMLGIGGIGTLYWHMLAHDQMRTLDVVLKKALGLKAWERL